MSKRLPYTPSSRIRSALRKLWLRSRERHAALRREGYRCEACGRKASRAKGREVKVEVHHRDGIGNWDAVIEAIRRHLLTHPDNLEVLCEDCHRDQHEQGENNECPAQDPRS